MSEIKQKSKDKKLTKKQLQKLERLKIKKALREWSIAVRNRDNNKCVICKTDKFLHAHHILPKEAKIFHFLRLDINNGISLCARHHKYSYEISPHKNPFLFMFWLINNKTKQVLYLNDKLKQKTTE